jgi:hypothetical protein
MLSPLIPLKTDNKFIIYTPTPIFSASLFSQHVSCTQKRKNKFVSHTENSWLEICARMYTSWKEPAVPARVHAHTHTHTQTPRTRQMMTRAQLVKIHSLRTRECSQESAMERHGFRPLWNLARCYYFTARGCFITHLCNPRTRQAVQ